MVLMQTRDGKVRERERRDLVVKVENMVRGTLMFSRHVAKLSTNVTDGHTSHTDTKAAANYVCELTTTQHKFTSGQAGSTRS